MPSRTSKAASAARQQVLSELKDDHRRVKKAYREFQKLDVEEDAETCQQIVEQVLQELTVHAALEEELLYPAARDAIADEDLIDEAEVEHESQHALIEQLQAMSPDDEKYMARFKVLCEYVLHHVKEEESELFPQLERARLDWEALGEEIAERRAELMGEEELEEGDEEEEADDGEALEADGQALAEGDDTGEDAPRPPAGGSRGGAGARGQR